MLTSLEALVGLEAVVELLHGLASLPGRRLGRAASSQIVVVLLRRRELQDLVVGRAPDHVITCVNLHSQVLLFLLLHLRIDHLLLLLSTKVVLLDTLQQLVVLLGDLYPEAFLLVFRQVLQLLLLLQLGQLQLRLPLFDPLQVELEQLLFRYEPNAAMPFQVLHAQLI